MAYLYVLWAVEDDLVKIGISKNQQKRQQTHSGNSSNPLNYHSWRLFKLESRDDAVKVEIEAKKELTRRGFQYRNKSEIFRCCPIEATKVIEWAAKRASIPILKNYPSDTTHLFSMGLDFIDLPYYLLDTLTPTERQAYLLGASNVLHIFEFLDGKFTAREISALSSASQQSELWGLDLWKCVVDRLAILIGPDDSRQSLIAEARRKIEKEQLEAFNQWQEIDDDPECDQAA